MFDLKSKEKRDYQRLWARRKRLAFMEDKKCEVCGGKKELRLCGLRTKNHRITAFFTGSEKTQNALLKKYPTKILCKTHYILYRRKLAKIKYDTLQNKVFEAVRKKKSLYEYIK